MINVLNVLGWLVELELQQANLLDRICSSPLLSADALQAAGALDLPTGQKAKPAPPAGQSSFGFPEN